MINAIGANPGGAQAAEQRPAAQPGANFQSFLSLQSDVKPAAVFVGKPGAGLISSPSRLRYSAEDTAALQRALTQAFNAAGIDTSQPIDLSTDGNGNVVVNGDNPQKAAIEKVFKDHPTLRGLDFTVAAEDSWQAVGQVTASYTRDYEKAVGNAAQTAVWDRYEPEFDKISHLGGDLTLSGGTLTSAALTYADSLFSKSSAG